MALSVGHGITFKPRHGIAKGVMAWQSIASIPYYCRWECGELALTNLVSYFINLFFFIENFPSQCDALFYI